MIVEEIKTVWSPANITGTILPIGVGIAIPLSFRDQLLRTLPSGFVARLGRFGISFAEALIGTGMAAVTFALPDNLKTAGRLAASASLALAGFDAITALIGGARKVESMGKTGPVFETTPAPAQAPQPVISYL